MKQLAVIAVLMLAVLTCKDPFQFQPGDPSYPDPPGPPTPVYPLDGKNTKEYGYPQDVEFQWSRVSGATFFQIEIYSDTTGTQLYDLVDQLTGPVSATVSIRSHGFYSWRVRAGSRNWNNYTDWSDRNWFILPNPTR